MTSPTKLSLQVLNLMSAFSKEAEVMCLLSRPFTPYQEVVIIGFEIGYKILDN